MAVNATGSIRLKRRPSGGAAGAPAALLTAEPAYNEADDTLYIGYGDDGNGNATSIREIAGAGKFARKEYVDEAVANAGAGDMLAADYDANGDGVVDNADQAAKVPWSGIQSKPSTFPPSAHDHDDASPSAAGFMSGSDKTKLDGIASGANKYSHPTGDGSRHVPATGSGDTGKVLRSSGTPGSEPGWAALAKGDVGLGQVDNTSDANKPISTAQAEALALKAPIASPEFTGMPTAPTPSVGTNTDQVATMAAIAEAIANIRDGAGSAYDTFIELQAMLEDNDSEIGDLVTAVAGKLAKAQNLADLPNKAAARSNLGLGSMAVQAANDVAITGGTIDGVEIDGGTF